MVPNKHDITDVLIAITNIVLNDLQSKNPIAPGTINNEITNNIPTAFIDEIIESERRANRP